MLSIGLSMTIRVLVNGAFGKMGQEVVKAIQQETNFQLVGQTGSKDNLAASINSSSADIVIDFTSPHVVFENTLTILSTNARPVIGTTGLASQQITELTQRASELKRGGIIAPNFSIGALLMMQFAQRAAKFYKDVEIIEAHHPGKLDAPSGTAIKTAEMIAANRPPNATLSFRETIPGSRGASYQGIPIHAIRLPGIVARQEVIFGGKGETLSICDNTSHREAFMPGVILGCKKVMELDHLVYGLEKVLDS